MSAPPNSTDPVPNSVTPRINLAGQPPFPYALRDMDVVHTIAEARAARAQIGRLALVPTMGALHGGHLALMQLAKRHAPHVAVSIFVNPTQFGPREDFNKYPRPIEQDLKQCEQAGVDMIFQPSVEEMYPPDAADAIVDLPSLSNVLEGRHRPGHFKGVCQVVAKLFNILTPDLAVFGQKDFQQLRILDAMARALSWPIEIIAGPTARDPDGMAISSRNQYLTPDERQRALSISRALMTAKAEAEKGIRQANRLVATMQNILLDVGSLGRIPVSIEYVAAVDPITLKPVDVITGPTLLAIAARVGTTRLIDNVTIIPPPSELPPSHPINHNDACEAQRTGTKGGTNAGTKGGTNALDP